MKRAIFLSILSSASLLSASSYIDQIGVRGGYSYAHQTLKEHALVDVKEIESNGWIYDLSMGFNVVDEGFFDIFKPYIDFTGRFYDDRSANILGLGLYHNFDPIVNFEPFVSAGVGYAMMRWDDAPLQNTLKRDKEMSSPVGTLQGGVLFPLNETLKLSLGARWDLYSFETQYKTESKNITQDDTMAFSILAGLNFAFGGSDAAVDYSDEPAVVAPAVAAATVAKELEPAVAAAPCDLSQMPRRLYFAFDDETLNEAAKKALDDTVDCMGDHPSTAIAFEGHADATGSKAYNQSLSSKRAASAKTYAVSKGLDASSILISGKGENEPIADNATQEGRAKNRRVEIYFIDQMAPVYFDYDSASITNVLERLEVILNKLKESPDSSITITGHTDSVGSDTFNKKLAQKRVDAVTNFLVGNGIDKSRINGVSEGESAPAADNETDSGRAKNRRAEMQFMH